MSYTRDSGEEELAAKKQRWRIRRAMFGNTGAGTSCNLLPSHVLLVYCKQNKVKVRDVMDHLVREKIV